MFRPARLSPRWMEASLEHCREPQWPADKNPPPCQWVVLQRQDQEKQLQSLCLRAQRTGLSDVGLHAR